MSEYSCNSCEWEGPFEEVEWGGWTPPGQDAFYETPDKADCPNCGSWVNG